jgi:hypothetical protein
LTPEQQAILKKIEAMKRNNPQNKAELKFLAKKLVSYDDREWDLKHGRRNDPGGRSRSPSFGKFKRDDEELR